MIKKILPYILAFLFLFILYSLYPFTKKWETITLGASLPLGGINKELGQEVLEGANAYFLHTNQNKGIRGKAIKFITYDDKYEPQNTLKNTKRLIEIDKVFALFGFVGTPTTKKILPIIDNIPFIAPYTGAAFLRESDKRNIINFRSSYGEEIENIVHFLHTTKKIKRFAIFYQNDDYGIAGYNATIKALNKRDLTLVGEGTYKRNTLSIKHALHEIQGAAPEAIIIVGAYKPSARFIRDWRRNHTQDVLFAPISFVNANALIRELHNQGENIYFSLTVPSYDNQTLDIVHRYKTLLHRYYPDSNPSYASFESFLAAKATVLALERIEGDITREKFITALQHLPKDALGKIPLSYNHTQLLNKVYLSIYHNGGFHPVKEEGE